MTDINHHIYFGENIYTPLHIFSLYVMNQQSHKSRSEWRKYPKLNDGKFDIDTPTHKYTRFWEPVIKIPLKYAVKKWQSSIKSTLVGQETIGYLLVCRRRGEYAYMTKCIMTAYRGTCGCAYTMNRGGCENVHPIRIINAWKRIRHSQCTKMYCTIVGNCTNVSTL